ncbi:MAG: TIGR03984 family CRISPR-associated protein [Candidatus Marinimicrobia bacterium]|nr:TIGR03984 family CRISPR-associated protein [Candidatus Neomarinimicrobiota bacterium]
MKANGLELLSIQSESLPVDKITNLSQVTEYINDASDVIIYLDNKVVIGQYQQGNFTFHDNTEIDFKYIRRIRVFNKNQELHLVRKNGILSGRLRNDTRGENTDCVEAHQVLFGTEAKSLDDYTQITEDRGTELLIPGDFEVNTQSKRVAIKTRHYLEYINGYQASYCDARFIDFVQLPVEGE